MDKIEIEKGILSMLEIGIGILFAAIGIGTHLAIRDAFRRDENGLLNLAKQGYGSMLSLSAFSYGHDTNRKQINAASYEPSRWKEC
jgi:hypothetical protein